MISVCNLPDYVALCRANLGAVTKNAERGTAFGIFKVSNQTKTELCVTRRFFGSGFFRFQSLHGMSEFLRDPRVSRRPVPTGKVEV